MDVVRKVCLGFALPLALGMGISFRSPLLPLGSGLCSAQTELTYIENSLPLSGGK